MIQNVEILQRTTAPAAAVVRLCDRTTSNYHLYYHDVKWHRDVIIFAGGQHDSLEKPENSMRTAWSTHQRDMILFNCMFKYDSHFK